MSGCPTLGALLDQAKTSGVSRSDAQYLLAHLLGKSRTWVIAHSEAPLPEELLPPWNMHIQSRAKGVPLAYLVGCKEFFSLNLHVSAHVLVPRPETESLVQWALEILQRHPHSPRVLDLGTGSGAIALAIQQACPTAKVLATDVSAAALDVARANAQRLRLPVEFELSDWWQSLGQQRFDVIVSNPPYVAENDPHLLDLRHEPLHALVSGPDGLHALNHLIACAPQYVVEGGWLLLEHGYNQAQDVQFALRSAGFEAIETRTDLADVPRCTGGQWPYTHSS